MAHVLLLLGDRPRHGYDLAESLRECQFEGVTTSLVYRELARLEDDGLVRSFWQASQARGPARHMYELTPAGRDALARCADDVRGLISHLTEFLGQVAALNGHEAAPPPAAAPAPDEDAAKARRRFWKPR